MTRPVADATSDPPETACAVCAQILSAARGPLGNTQWVHSAPADHLTVPVPAGQINSNVRCDFCLDDHAEWILPVSAYSVAGVGRSGEDWAACSACRADIVAGRWETIVDRAALAMKYVDLSDGKAVLRAMYAEVREHMLGEPYRRR